MRVSDAPASVAAMTKSDPPASGSSATSSESMRASGGGASRNAWTNCSAPAPSTSISTPSASLRTKPLRLSRDARP